MRSRAPASALSSRMRATKSSADRFGAVDSPNFTPLANAGIDITYSGSTATFAANIPAIATSVIDALA